MSKVSTNTQPQEINYLKILADYTSDLISLAEPDGTFVYASPSFEAVTGYSPYELIGTNPYQYFFPDDRDAIRTHSHLPALEGQTIQKIVYRWITKTGQLIWLETFTQPIFDEENNEIIYLASSTREVTQQRETLDALHRSEARLRMILDHTKDMFLVMGANLDLEFISPSVTATLGYTLEEFNAVPIEDVIHLQDHNLTFKEGRLRLLTDEEAHIWEFRIRHKDSRYIWVEAYTEKIVDDDGNLIHIIVSMRDISERVEARSTLKYQANLLQNISDAVIATDHDFTIQSWNKAAENIFGWAAHEVFGRNITEVFRAQGNDRVVEIFSQLIAGLDIWKGDLLHRHKDGRKLIIECSVSLLLNETDDPVGLISINRDVTEDRKQQEMMRQQQTFIQALYETSSTVTSSLQLDDVLDAILDSIMRAIPLGLATLVLLENQQIVRVQREGNLPVEEWLDLEKNPVLKQVAEQGASILLTDVQSLEKTSGIEDWVQTLLAVPIKYQQNVIGLLIMKDQNSEHLGKQHISWLETFASYAAIAIQNARMYEETEARTHELAALYRATGNLFDADNKIALAQRISDIVVEEFGKIDCGIILIDRNTLKLTRVARSGLQLRQPKAQLDLDGKGLVPAAVRAQETIYAPDVLLDPRYVPNVSETRSELVIPLKTEQGELLGAMDLQSTELNAFTKTDLRLLNAFAERAALALENIILYERIRSYNVNLEQQVTERTQQYFLARDRVETILNNSSDAIVLTTLNGHIDQVNLTFNSWFNAQPDDYFDHNIREIFDTSSVDQVEQCFQTLRDGQKHARTEALIKTRFGRQINVDVALSTISDENGRSVICSLRDISTQKQMEAGLITALESERELNSMKSQFISLVSHEFRSPLTTIISSTLLMKDFWDRMPEERKLRHIEKILMESNRLTGLMENVLTMSKAEITGLDFNPALVEFSEFIQETVEQFQSSIAPHQTIIVIVAQQRISAIVDTYLMTMLMRNLLSNAAKYSPPDTQIRIITEADGDFVKLTVSDQGIGISTEEQEKMFTRFHRGANVRTITGTGLGLSIVKQIVDLHQGHIHTESEIGVGTTFTITLPLQPPLPESLA